MTDRPLPLTIRDLSKSYGRRTILRGVDLTVGDGDAVAVVGANGAGKSTLLGCIAADRLPDGGEIRICGKDPFSDLAAVARCIGVVPEQAFLYGELTVGEVLAFVREVRGDALVDGEREALRLLANLGLEDTQAVLCRELSQGMGRKLSIILALLHRPRLIVLDEAFNGLDAPSADALLEELEARRAAGAGVLVSSHDLGLLARFCNRGVRVGGTAVVPLEGADWERWREAPSLNPV